MQKLSDHTLLAAVAAVKEHGSQRKAAKALGIGQSRVNERIKEAKSRKLVREIDGQVGVFESTEMPLPPKGKKKVYIVTCAQDYTKLHSCWKDLKALAEHDNATLMVSTFKYNKDAQGQRAASKFETREQELAALYPDEIIPYICDDRVDLAPALSFCGELNILPTASKPLSGMRQYTYRKSTIVPHPKLALESVPAMRGEGVKLLYTTGCITQRNYIKRKVGFQAEHFHSYGGLIVEVDDTGSWWVRQLVVGADGSICDLDRRVKNGHVTVASNDRRCNWVEDLNFGDCHAAAVDPVVADISWGHRPDSMLEVLRPKSVHVQDLQDNGGRSHHMRKDPHAVFKAHLTGAWVLSTELALTAHVLWDDISRPWCETYVVDSNHNRHLDRFLKEVDWRDDPANARLILALNLLYLDAIAAGTDDKLSMTEAALRQSRLQTHGGFGTNPVRFLLEDEGHVILPHIDGGIESGLHGDRGANGAKGTIGGIGGLDRKTNAADKHQVAIMNGAYFNGTSSKLVQSWNHGLSSWTHAHTVTYTNGARTIVSIWKGKWRA